MAKIPPPDGGPNLFTQGQGVPAMLDCYYDLAGVDWFHCRQPSGNEATTVDVEVDHRGRVRNVGIVSDLFRQALPDFIRIGPRFLGA